MSKKRYSLAIDLDRCTGCKACSIACKTQNDVDLGVFWNRVYKQGPEGSFPNLEMFFFPKQCMHCDEPLCVEVCPTKATYITDDGIVLVDHDRCIGCSYCIWACPYSARTLNPKTHMVEKCMLCAHRVEQGNRPSCVDTCLGNARYFGDLSDPTSEISRYLSENSDRRFQVHPEIGTNPSVIYLMPRKGAEKLCQYNTL